MEAHDGLQIVGMDLHRRRSVLVGMSEDGRKLGTSRISNSPARLAAEIARAGEHPKVVLRSVRDFARKEWPLRGSPADVRSCGVLRSAGG